MLQKLFKTSVVRKKLIKSGLVSWALMQAFRLSGKHMLSLVIFLFSYLFLSVVEEKAKGILSLKKESRTVGLLSGVFTFLYLCGDIEGLTIGLTNLAFKLCILTVCAIGFFILFYEILRFLFVIRRGNVLSCNNSNTFINKCSPKKVAIGSFLLCLLGWIPHLLISFPGNITIDSVHQYAQILEIYEQSNHHPWIHTQLIKLFYNIGLLFTDDPSCAMGFYTIFQMVFMAACVAYLMVFLHRKQLKDRVYWAVIIFYAFVPFNGAFSVAMIKDVLFANFVMLYTLATFNLLLITQDKEKWIFRKNIPTLILYVFSGIGMCLFRSNGYYAFLFMIPFSVYAFRKYLLKILILQSMILVVVLGFKGPVLKANNVVSPDLVEHLSIPGQQISRVLINERELTEKQNAFLNSIMDVSRIEEGYKPDVSDWFKKLVRVGNQEYLKENFSEFIKIYIEIGLKYPQDYLSAFRDQSRGYWFPMLEQEHIVGNDGVAENEFGLVHRPILKGALAVKINEILFKLQNIVPFYGILWSMGSYFWVLLICMAMVFVYGEKRNLLLYMPAIGIFLTLVIATPVAYDFRYAYGYIFCMPLYLIISCLPKSRKKEENKEVAENLINSL
ncbi:MAG: hypothetical protein IJX66_01595 [Lachnospiraceae bacterium]|nr:hypothetical protein [Lachnospiraceae bacterium]